jgi:hypothetical protein
MRLRLVYLAVEALYGINQHSSIAQEPQAIFAQYSQARLLSLLPAHNAIRKFARASADHPEKPMPLSQLVESYKFWDVVTHWAKERLEHEKKCRRQVRDHFGNSSQSLHQDISTPAPFPYRPRHLFRVEQGFHALGTPPRRVALQHRVQSALAARDRRVHVAIDHAIEGRQDPLFQLPVPVRAERE